jgi:hypothetical protein
MLAILGGEGGQQAVACRSAAIKMHDAFSMTWRNQDDPTGAAAMNPTDRAPPESPRVP